MTLTEFCDGMERIAKEGRPTKEEAKHLTSMSLFLVHTDGVPDFTLSWDELTDCIAQIRALLEVGAELVTEDREQPEPLS